MVNCIEITIYSLSLKAEQNYFYVKELSDIYMIFKT